ncbi:ERF family protein [Streptomyces lavendulocolor]|uniref:ERF family protein n=1 Tax=Streptomyces lavendulocolor TaxID=67316 RepID=UPI003C2D1E69
MADTTTVAEHATENPPAASDRVMTVDEAMTAVMREIAPVGKNGRNEYQGYDFRAYEDIVAAVRGPMVKYGLKLLPRVIKQEHFVRGESTNVAILTVEYTVRGPAGDTMDTPIVVVGEGADRSDKASNKAMTAAKKYAYLQAFEIADGSDDGDRDHPVAAGSVSDRPKAAANPLAWYIEQINQRDVWFSSQKLRALLDKAEAAGVAGLHMPDRPGVTFFQVVDAQGRKLHAEEEARARRQAEERAAKLAQMSAEYPDPPDPYDDGWEQATPHQPASARAPQRPAPAPSPARAPAAPTPPPASAPVWQAPVLPDPAEVESAFATALADPEFGWQSLHDLREHHGTVALAQITINTGPWGAVDANSAITMAITNWAGLMEQLAPTPEQTAAVPTETTPSEPAEEPSPLSERLRLAKHSTRMGASERATEAMRAEVQLQAQMLGKPTLDFVAEFLPEGGTSIEQVQGGSRLQDFIRENRPHVVAAFIAQQMPKAAEAYAEFGDRVPARNINKFLKDVLGVGES